MPGIHPPIPSQHTSLPNNLKMLTPLDIRKNLGSLFCQPSESSATLASHLAAERSTTTQIGTWLCPCKHTNKIHNHLVSHPRNPLGTLCCGVCGRPWSESCISSITFTSPVRTVKFHNPVPRPRDDAPILHASLPLEKDAVLCYICTHDGCGTTWKAKVSRALLSRMPYAVVLSGGRKECACETKAFESEKYALIELAFRERPWRSLRRRLHNALRKLVNGAATSQRTLHTQRI
jgi:hypothetical protein